jgi:hypothetical protein
MIKQTRDMALNQWNNVVYSIGLGSSDPGPFVFWSDMSARRVVWFSPPALGAGFRWFKSSRADQIFSISKLFDNCAVNFLVPPHILFKRAWYSGLCPWLPPKRRVFDSPRPLHRIFSRCSLRGSSRRFVPVR